MKKIIALALAAGFAVGAAGIADAREGCGPDGHRGPYGHCRPNHDRYVARAPGVDLVIGNFYTGRGYWDGHRYYMHRRHWHDGWRYY